jgi:hypothetical protein
MSASASDTSTVHLAFGSNVSELDSSRGDEFECRVNILRLLDAHAGIPVVSAQRDVPYTELSPVMISSLA